MTNARIISTGSYLPGDPLTNDDIEKIVGPLSPELLAQVNAERRHWMIDPVTGEHRETSSGMAAKAVLQALELAGLAAEHIELLIVSSSSPDYPLPPMVTFVQDKLSLQRCATLEIRSGCAGAVGALDVARLYLERGIYRNAVVIGCEAISPILAPSFVGKDPNKLRVRDRLSIYSFGDGAAAIVLQATEDHTGILGSAMACVGGGKKPGLLIPVGGTSSSLINLQDQRLEFRVDYAASSKFTPYVQAEALKDLLARSSVDTQSIDLCVMPEVNANELFDQLREAGLLTPDWLALQGKIFENIAVVGSTGSAALPLALDHAWKTGRVKAGDCLMLLAIEISKWMYGGMILNWSAPPCPVEVKS